MVNANASSEIQHVESENHTNDADQTITEWQKILDRYAHGDGRKRRAWAQAFWVSINDTISNMPSDEQEKYNSFFLTTLGEEFGKRKFTEGPDEVIKNIQPQNEEGEFSPGIPTEIQEWQKIIDERYPNVIHPYRVLGRTPRNRSISGLFDTYGHLLKKDEVFTEHSIPGGTVVVTATLSS